MMSVGSNMAAIGGSSAVCSSIGSRGDASSPIATSDSPLLPVSATGSRKTSSVQSSLTIAFCCAERQRFPVAKFPGRGPRIGPSPGACRTRLRPGAAGPSRPSPGRSDHPGAAHLGSRRPLASPALVSIDRGAGRCRTRKMRDRKRGDQSIVANVEQARVSDGPGRPSDRV